MGERKAMSMISGLRNIKHHLENEPVFECAVCRKGGQTLRCSQCHITYYCSKEHQRQDWKRHKSTCQKLKNKKLDANQNQTQAITYEGSSENEILNTQTQTLSPSLLDFETEMPPQHFDTNKPSSDHDHPLIQRTPTKGARSQLLCSDKNEMNLEPTSRVNSPNSSSESTLCDQISKNVIRDLEEFGVCVVDNFLGIDRGTMVYNEVLNMYESGVFKDGQLVSSTGRDGDRKTIRGDQITWIGHNEGESVTAIGQLIRDVDTVIKRANQMSTGRLSKYTINGRTKAMVACYPGSGAHYVKHVDNPNSDGRCVTAIYYLNRDWDAKRFGGLLRIFPEGSDKVADIAPLFDRLLFFWSDRSNPHEVQPAYQTRYAITLWYFDQQEREQACKRFNSNKPVKEKDGEP